MTFRWNSVPLLRYLIAFSGGIVLQIFLPGFLFETLSVFIAAVAILALFTYYKPLAEKFRFRFVFGIASVLVFITAGSIITWTKTENNFPDHFTKIANGECIFSGMINEPLSEKTSSYKTIFNVQAVYCNDKWQQTSGKMMLYLSKDSTNGILNYGDRILVKAKAKPIPLPQNPSEFNYKRFLYFHQIYVQAYARSNQISNQHKNSGNPILSIAYSIRKTLVQLLKENIPDQRQYAVAEALTVGYEDDLDQELIQAFASAGALHVLSVSGMHVGLIFASLLMLLQWTDKIRHAHHFKFALVLLVIWVYALITGMSPSIMRSAVMITLMIIARWRRLSTSLYNTLAVSALGLLIYNPYYITEVGFQLSYAAVFGIVYLHPMVNRWYEPESWLMSQIWMITSVSIAAQTMTFPLGLLYFHQFPNLFVISNLIIIPLSTVVIYGCILLLAFSYFKVIAIIFGKLLWGIIWLINKTVFLVDAWQYSLINGISISIFETWIIYLILFFVILFLTDKRPFHFQAALVGVCFILLMQLVETEQINSQKKLIVYNAKGLQALNFVDGKQNIFVADSALRFNRSKMLFHVVHNWWDMGVYDAEPRIAYTALTAQSKSANYVNHNGCIRFYERNILLVDSMFQYIELPALHFDYVIVSHNAFSNLMKLPTEKFKTIVVDASNNFKTQSKIKRWCAARKITCFVVAEQCAFVTDI